MTKKTLLALMFSLFLIPAAWALPNLNGDLMVNLDDIDLTPISPAPDCSFGTFPCYVGCSNGGGTTCCSCSSYGGSSHPNCLNFDIGSIIPSLSKCEANYLLGLPEATAGTEKTISCTSGMSINIGDQYIGNKVYKCESTTWTLKTNTCQKVECEAGVVMYEPCGSCGTRTKTCGSNRFFGSWSSCLEL